MSAPNPNEGIEKIPRFLRPGEKQSKEKRLQAHESAMENPNINPAGKARLARAAEAVRHDIESQTPKPLSAAARDRCDKRIKTLEEQIAKGMPSDEEMRRSPDGSVSQHMSWEKSNKRNIKEWKNLQLALEPDMDPQTANYRLNVERLRHLRNPLRDPNHNADIQPTTSRFFPPDPQSLGPNAGWPFVDFDALVDDESDARKLAESEEKRAAAEAELAQLREQLSDNAAKTMQAETRVQKAKTEENRRRSELKRGR